MPLKVIGAGLGRTGTMSLKLALEQLGLGRCYHMMEVFQNPGAPELWERAGNGEKVDWEEVFKGYGATVDWPSCEFYRPLAERYPDAKIILTERDPDAWFESTQKTIFDGMDEAMAEADTPWKRMVKAIIGAKFGGRLHDRAHAIAVYKAHNDEVRRTIPKNRLLVYEGSQGWAPLCGFLGLAVPSAPYPKVNTTDDFLKMRAAMREKGEFPSGH